MWCFHFQRGELFVGNLEKIPHFYARSALIFLSSCEFCRPQSVFGISKLFSPLSIHLLFIAPRFPKERGKLFFTLPKISRKNRAEKLSQQQKKGSNKKISLSARDPILCWPFESEPISKIRLLTSQSMLNLGQQKTRAQVVVNGFIRCLLVKKPFLRKWPKSRQEIRFQVQQQRDDLKKKAKLALNANRNLATLSN